MHDGHVQRIASGYHPVVAAPGYAMYYLWALAGREHDPHAVVRPRARVAGVSDRKCRRCGSGSWGSAPWACR